MRIICLFSLLAVGLLALTPVSASAQVVTDKKSCLQAVADAREASDAAAISEKARNEIADLVRISEHLCTQANFVYAERLLAIARGMAAQE